MKNIIKLEEFAMLGFCVCALNYLESLHWWCISDY